MEKKMSSSQAFFEIIEDNNCPLYELGDQFELSDIVLSFPKDKPTCITLVGDIKEILTLCKSDDARRETGSRYTFDCGGCTGTVWLEYRREKKEADEKAVKREDSDISSTANLLRNFSIFQALDEHHIKALVAFLKLKEFGKGESVIKKGEPGVNLFIIVSGKVEVVGDDGLTITFLGKGEVFGEMSLLSGDPVGATIKVVAPAKVLCISGKDLRKMLLKIPSLQMYFTRLLARRLTQTNIIRSEEFASGMVGRLSEMPPTEIFQTLHQNQKSGILSLQLPKGTAEVFFREGGLIQAKYGRKEGTDAFFALLKCGEGRFKFVPGLPPEEQETPELGDFMWLLMEGLNRIDEEESAAKQ